MVRFDLRNVDGDKMICYIIDKFQGSYCILNVLAIVSGEAEIYGKYMERK